MLAAHCKSAQDHFISEIESSSTPIIALVQEPYLYKDKPTLKIQNSTIHCSTEKGNRSIMIIPKSIKTLFVNSLSNKDFTTALIEDDTGKKVVCTSGYMDIKYKAEDMFPMLDKIISYSQTNNHGLIMGLDTNAHSSMWNSINNNHRGNLLEEWILQNNLSILNNGSTPTFVGHQGNTIIDVTLTDSSTLDLVHHWMVNEDDQLSDHRRIEFMIKFSSNKIIRTRNLKNADWQKFRRLLSKAKKAINPIIWTKETLENRLKEFYEKVNKALNETCPIRTFKVKNHKNPSDWWSSELENLKQNHRRCERTHKRRRRQSSHEKFQNAKKQYKKAKTQSWIDKCSEIQDIKSLSRLNKGIMSTKNPDLGLLKKKDGSTCSNAEESLKELFDCHFPGSLESRAVHGTLNGTVHGTVDGTVHGTVDRTVHGIVDRTVHGTLDGTVHGTLDGTVHGTIHGTVHGTVHGTEEKDNPKIPHSFIESNKTTAFITLEKVKAAIASFHPMKAAGPDDLRPIVLQNLNDESFEELKTIYRASLALGYIPKLWCKSVVVFISKPGKASYDNSKSYRPISLTCFAFKAAERIFLWEIEQKVPEDPTHQNQYAFKKTKQINRNCSVSRGRQN